MAIPAAKPKRQTFEPKSWRALVTTITGRATSRRPPSTIDGHFRNPLGCPASMPSMPSCGRGVSGHT